MLTQNKSLKFDPQILSQFADQKKAAVFRGYFKNSNTDTFLGVPKKVLRGIAKEYELLCFHEILKLMQSNVHEEKTVASEILCMKFKKGDERGRKEVFDFYIENREWIRDWDAVDDTAPLIVGAWLFDKDKDLLYEYAQSARIWDRRIAIVSTLYMIRKGIISPTLRIACMLLKDPEDLIHKAAGWMLREVGKKDLSALETFLTKHHLVMPRTMLRYAIEKFPQSDRTKYLRK